MPGKRNFNIIFFHLSNVFNNNNNNNNNNHNHNNQCALQANTNFKVEGLRSSTKAAHIHYMLRMLSVDQ